MTPRRCLQRLTRLTREVKKRRGGARGSSPRRPRQQPRRRAARPGPSVGGPPSRDPTGASRTRSASSSSVCLGRLRPTNKVPNPVEVPGRVGRRGSPTTRAVGRSSSSGAVGEGSNAEAAKLKNAAPNRYRVTKTYAGTRALQRLKRRRCEPFLGVAGSSVPKTFPLRLRRGPRVFAKLEVGRGQQQLCRRHRTPYTL